MSLQAWYPFDGNIKNYGVGALSLTETTAPTYSSPGKLGSKALATGGFKWTAAQSATVLNNDAISFAFWIKALNTTSGQIFGTGGMGANNNRKFAIFAYPTGNDLHLSWMNDAASATFAGGRWDGVFPTNMWVHCCITYNNPSIIIYLNGEQKFTTSGTSASSSFAYETQVIHSSANRLIQDFRVYNHCLSPREVKQISQGLILHMPLKDTEGEATTNVAPYPTPGASATADFNWDQTLHPNAIKVSGWAAGHNGGVGNPTSGYHAHWQLIDGLPTMVFPNLNSYLSLGSRWLGISSNSIMQSRIGPSTTYTISFDARADVHNMFLRTGYYYQITGATSKNFHDGYGDFYLSTQWKRYSCTFTTKSTLDTTIGASIYFYGHNGSVNGTSYVRNIQVELKDHATAYTKDTRTSTLMDCSGYGHHGEGVGTLITNANSARYDNCIYISDGRTNYGKSGPLTMPTDQVTMSCWIKTSATGYGSYHIPLSFNSANYEFSIASSGCFRNGFTIGGSRSVLTTSHTSILDGKWHMITATYDGEKIRRYLDGNELTAYATTITGSLVGGTSNVLIGNYNGTNYGNKETYMSDVRIYATALNADDIKTLYQSRIAMLDNGAITAYEYKEGELTNIKMTEEGVTRLGNLGEVCYVGGMKTKILSDGSAWARIHWLNLQFDKTVFANDTEVAFCDKANRFSRMGLVDHFKTAAGVYEFMLTYPKLSATAYNRWQQTNSPNVAANAGTGHVKITTAWTMYSAPITKSASGGSATYSMNDTSNWWAPIGQKTLFSNTGIPAADGSTQLETELWVRIDNLPAITKLSLLDNKHIQATEIYEI